MRSGNVVQREYSDAAGTRMHAEVSGQSGARNVVCVHGLGVSHRYFRPFLDRLAPRFRVSAPDLPGFGRSPGPRQPLDVRGLSRALADWLRVTRRQGAVLVANSAGCQVVIDMAVHAPELLGPLVLNGPTVDRYARSVPRQLARLVADAWWEHPALLLTVARDYAVANPRRMLATLRFLLHDPVERNLPRVPAPAVVVRGSRDPLVSRAWANEVADLLPDGRLIEVAAAGHALNFSAPAELAGITATHAAAHPR